MTPANEKITVFNLFDRDTVLHLRVPFSFFLLPVFVFGISQAPVIDLYTTSIIFIAIHLLIYPGSNVYNSYMDKDEGSIGGLRNPPPVTRRLYYASIVCDIAGLLLAGLAGWKYPLIISGYVAFSKSYSWTGIRVKKYPYLGWTSVMFFQGGYTYMMANMAATKHIDLSWFTAQNLECMLIASLLIGGSYPLTQIYQHEEDGRRGDHTISYRLGIKGTFIFTSVLFLCGALVTLHYFCHYYTINYFLIFLACLLPVVIYFSYWFIKSMKDKSFADYSHAMLMNKIASACMTVCFVIILVINQTPNPRGVYPYP
jgi:1,4-dihydroxy-2-naphthoate octaprenyltransferase